MGLSRRLHEVMREVLIVGGGASGILVATHIAKVATSPMSVTIAEPAPVLGAGLAYSTRDGGHLLNVPAGRMSAFSNIPAHFQEWAGCEAGDFISRKRYGRYLLETFIETQLRNPFVSFRHERVKVESIDEQDGSFHVLSESGPLGKFDSVVLATGHGMPLQPSLGDTLQHSTHYVDDPWRDPIPAAKGLMVSIGTGLTFIDLALSHLRRDPLNTVLGVSRTGELPRAHLHHRSAPLSVPESARSNPTALRSYIEGSSDWRAAQDGVRHEMPEIWHRWSEGEKKDFWDSHLRWWNVHRHRMAPAIADELNEWREKGRLTFATSDSLSFRELPSGICIDLPDGQSTNAEIVVNTTGYASAETSPLIESMRRRGLVEIGPLGLGIRSNFPDHELIASDGGIRRGLYGNGPILLGERLETTAIPEIRDQAAVIAQALV